MAQTQTHVYPGRAAVRRARRCRAPQREISLIPVPFDNRHNDEVLEDIAEALEADEVAE